MLDVALAIDGEGRNVTLSAKTGSGYNADGEGVASWAAPVTIHAVVQPASGRTLMDVSEGKRSECKWFIWTRTTLKEDDLITFEEGQAQVIQVWDRRPDGGFVKAALGGRP